MSDTIFALSSGLPPAAISVLRISGPQAAGALSMLVGRLPAERRATSMNLRDASGLLLDRALVLWLPGPGTATGEDTAELHCHGGRAVVAAIEAALAALPQLRRATPGEFTRRAFTNGRIDLAEAEGLADLLSAETELQRQSAMAMAGGALSRQIGEWRDRLLAASAELESALDFGDEDDVALHAGNFAAGVLPLRTEIAEWLARPRAEMLREGYRVVIAGPPNLGKSTLFNALIESDAAITTPIAGTTRDVLTRPVSLEGIPFLFADTAGLHDKVNDEVEAIGIERALEALDRADLVLWLGPEGQGPRGCWDIASQIDRSDSLAKRTARHRISATTGAGMEALRQDLIETARGAMPRPGDAVLSERQHRLLLDADLALADACSQSDPLIAAEGLRLARLAFDALLGHSTTENMLDVLFGRFCIGK